MSEMLATSGSQEKENAASAASYPRLVLRVGFAGKRDLSVYREGPIKERVGEVLNCLARQMVEIAPNTLCSTRKEIPELAHYFDRNQLPLLRLVTGLCEGADTLAFQALEELEVPHMAKESGNEAACLVGKCDHGQTDPCLEKENAAVIGFDFDDYLASRKGEDRAELVRQAKAHQYILVADGKLRKEADEPENAERDKMRRGRGYRSQSELLLRQSDIMVVVVDPKESGSAGGSLETLRNALAFQLPVVLINPRLESVLVIEPGDYLPDELEKKSEADWQAQLQDLVLRLTADEERGRNVKNDDLARHGLPLLDEYFKDVSSPPQDAKGKRKPSSAEKLWDKFYGCFKGPKPMRPALPESAKHYKEWRGRATSLNYHYAGLYRGTFFLNCCLAVCAVSLAAISLVMLGNGETALAQEYKKLFELGGENGGGDSHGGSVHLPGWFYPVLWVLAALKLTIVIFIFRNTTQANKQHWNDRMVDYRYLAERLRGMFFLPEVGSWQPPAAAPAQYASRVVRQSAVDWLFDAISRSVSPALWAKEVAFEDGHIRLIALSPQESLKTVQEGWLVEQCHYHEANQRDMGRLTHALETWGLRLNQIVIGVVVIDLILLALEFLGKLPHAWHDPVKWFGPWIVLFAAVLPAVVAALNVVRFQSECQRLAERSSVLGRMLGGRKQKNETSKGGKVNEALNLLKDLEEDAVHQGQAGRVLHFTEGCAEIFVQEAAEWSVLYAKETVEV